MQADPATRKFPARAIGWILNAFAVAAHRRTSALQENALLAQDNTAKLCWRTPEKLFCHRSEKLRKLGMRWEVRFCRVGSRSAAAADADRLV
jgi:hypothetical protein